MNRLEKMEHLQINLNTWFSEWASYANEKERIGARMLGRNKSLELSISFRTIKPFIANLSYDVCFYTGVPTLKISYSTAYNFPKEIKDVLQGIDTSQVDYYKMEEIELVGESYLDKVQIKNFIAEKTIAFFVWKTKLDASHYIIP
jgi:hypothetical protein